MLNHRELLLLGLLYPLVWEDPVFSHLILPAHHQAPGLVLDHHDLEVPVG